MEQILKSYSTLPDLHDGMKKCRACQNEGFEIYPPAVFSGVDSAIIMTIGQAPGITEQEAERPFNAGSGTRLFGWLAQAGIEENWFRTQQYMTSVTKCYPGRAKSGSGDRVPSRKEQALCRPFLEREIELVDPKVIIPIGRLAINLFYSPKEVLRDIIGTRLNIEGRWVIPLPHSSGASRWHQIEENRLLINKAISLIKDQYEGVFG